MFIIYYLIYYVKDQKTKSDSVADFIKQKNLVVKYCTIQNLILQDYICIVRATDSFYLL